MKFNKIYFSIALVISTWFTSCKECAYDYKYEVVNNTNYDVKIKWSQKLYSLDSLTLKPRETKELFTTGHGIESCGDIPIFGDVDQDLETFQAVKLDTVQIESNLNYLSNNSWEFIDGTYRATITESEF